MAGRALTITEGMLPMAAGDLNKILAAIEGWRGENREALATLKAEMGFVSRDVNALTAKVERMEESKVSWKEVEAVEGRMIRSVADVKAGAAFEAGRLSQDLTTRLEAAALELHDFREAVADEFKQLRERDIKELRDKVATQEAARNRIIGGWAVAGTIGAAIWAAIGWLIQWMKKGP